VADSILTYTHYLGKAGAAPLHNKPWYYYFSLLLYTKRAAGPWWSEGLIVGLAAVGGVAAFVQRGENSRFLRFLTVYTVVLIALYSLIPYKTPWCAINFLQPMTLLAGLGAVVIIRAVRFRLVQAAALALLAIATVQLGQQAYRANFVYPADIRNPYVYAHTSTALVRMVERVEDIARVSPEGRDMLIRVVCPNGDYWPLPWYLRRFTHVGYWTSIPTQRLTQVVEADAPMILMPASLQAQIDPVLKQHYQVEFYALRPGVLWFAYTRSDLWDALIATRR
jgi:predicted membrane-bound mannosyltransferase